MITKKNKSAKTVVAVCLAVVVLLIVGIVGLFVYQTWQNGWQIDNSTLAKFGIVFAGLVLTMIKLISSNAAVGFLFKDIVERKAEIALIPPDPPISLSISLVWKKNKFTSAAMREFKDYVERAGLFLGCDL